MLRSRLPTFYFFVLQQTFRYEIIGLEDGGPGQLLGAHSEPWRPGPVALGAQSLTRREDAYLRSGPSRVL